MSQIYTPLSCVAGILHHSNNLTHNPRNYQTCTKIVFGSYEISIAMDQSLMRNNDLKRTEIRIYQDEKDVTSEFMDAWNEIHSPDDEVKEHTFTTSEQLFWIMNYTQGK